MGLKQSHLGISAHNPAEPTALQSRSYTKTEITTFTLERCAKGRKLGFRYEDRLCDGKGALAIPISERR